MSGFVKLVLLIPLLELCILAYGQTNIPGVCVGVTPCYCKFNNGQFLDISSLGKTDGTPQFLNVTDNHEMAYSWNPCFGFTEGPCLNVSIMDVDLGLDHEEEVCAIRPAFPDDIYIPLGYPNTATFLSDTKQGQITLQYTTAGDGKTPTMNSYISLQCEPNSGVKHTLKALGPPTQTSTDYYFELSGALACPQGNANTTPKPPGSSLSTAAKAGIITASLAIAIGGVVTTTIILKRKGKICTPKYDAIE